ncbi:MAG: hypothetical protein JWN70_5926 [Planctomycetaceae bacterium]|nr:hypothetical protein [Planctomycetaceae bacterium]
METHIKRNWLAIAILGGFGLVGVTLAVNGVAALLKFSALSQAVNDAKWIGLALHQYHDQYNSFPPAVVYDDHGVALHSWRALIQPQLTSGIHSERQFPEYDLTKSWNQQATANSPLLQQFEDQRYRFFAVVGPDAAWPRNGTRNIREITDGTSNTILLIGLRHSNVKWQQPLDLTVNGKTLLLGDRPVDLTKDVFVLRADGGTNYYEHGIPPDELARLLTIAGGDVPVLE